MDAIHGWDRCVDEDIRIFACFRMSEWLCVALRCGPDAWFLVALCGFICDRLFNVLLFEYLRWKGGNGWVAASGGKRGTK